MQETIPSAERPYIGLTTEEIKDFSKKAKVAQSHSQEATSLELNENDETDAHQKE